MDFDLLERISNVPGVSGHEKAAQDLVAAEMRDHCDELYEDRIGNIIGVKRATEKVEGERPLRVVIAAHVDEFGFIVRQINGDGFIKVGMMSGADPSSLMGHQIVIRGKEDVVGVLAPKRGKDDKGKPKIEDLLIDTGRPKAWVEERVSLGDVGWLNLALTKINDKTVSCRNFDDRLGTYCMVKALKEIEKLSVDLYCVSTVQEEIGVRGAHVVATVIDADIGLAIDGGCPMDAYKRDMHCDLGTGVAVYVLDKLTVGSKRLVDFLCKTCDEQKIPYRRTWDGGTDASALQRDGSGALATTIGAPTRYMHTPCQMANLDDIDATTALARHFAEGAHTLLPDGKPWRSLK